MSFDQAITATMNHPDMTPEQKQRQLDAIFCMKAESERKWHRFMLCTGVVVVLGILASLACGYAALRMSV